MKGISILALLLFLLSSNGLLVGQAQNRRGSSAPVKISAEEAAAHLLTTMKPAYPHVALVNAIQGPVVLQAVVGKDGSIEKLKIISGNPILAHAFAGTVQQTWKYKPFLVNGAPVEAEFPIEYVFKLD
jgi:outer membrane biosynthesis protein TonB